MKSAKIESPTVLPGDSLVPLEAVLCTEELNGRPARPPDYENENRALISLAQALADSPHTILQKLADTILEVFKADSAGISLLTEDETGFYWPAIAGLWRSHIGGGTPRGFGPCGDVLDRNEPLLFRHPERRYTYFLEVTPPVEECLLVPFYVEGKAVGTIWAIAHDDRRKFDAEDERQLLSLGRFASTAYQAVALADALAQQGETLQHNHTDLAHSMAELRKVTEQAQDSRRAALNLMEDAVRSRQAMETLNGELRESDERYRSLFAAAPMAVFVCDRNAVIQNYNRRAVELWGREPACGVDKHCGSMKLWLPTGELLPHAQSPMVEVLRTGIPALNVEVSIERPDGSRLPVLVNFAPLKNEQGEITGAISSFMDITERKKAEEILREAEERLRFMAESMPQKIFTARPNGDVDYFNQQWMEFTGLSFEQIKAWGWTQFIHPDDVAENVRVWQHSIDTCEPFQFEHRFRRADGEYRWHLSRARAMRDAEGNVLMWIGSNTDFDDVKRAEEERERLLALEQQARRAAETANRVRDEFLATISHELRTPLTAISGWAEVLHRRVLDEQTTDRAIEAIARNARSQSRLISDLLDVSRAITGKLRFEVAAVDLIPVIEAATEAVRPAADGKGVELRMMLDPMAGLVSGDDSRLQQVVWNLLSNAIKYTTKGGRVEVTLKSLQTDVAITVADTGEGISAEFLPYIFDRFRQADSTTTRQHDGLGLGLAIVRHMVEAHGGTVNAESRGAGHGATFTVTLPMIEGRFRESDLRGPHAKDAQVQASESKRLVGVRLVLVDDDRDAGEVLSLVLKLEGAEVRAGASGREALEIVDQWKPDVLVSDIGMPGEDGYHLIRELRAREDEFGGLIPAIALTGYAGDQDATRAREAGFQMHLPKPVELAKLITAVARLATLRGASPQTLGG